MNARKNLKNRKCENSRGAAASLPIGTSRHCCLAQFSCNKYLLSVYPEFRCKLTAESVVIIYHYSCRILNQNKNLHYTRRVTPKRVTSCGDPSLRFSAWQHSSEETSQQSWRHCADLTGPGIKPQTSRTDCLRVTTELTDR